MLTLAIETSCDDTSVAVVEKPNIVLSNVVASQIATHIKYGGVVPEIASRMHIESIELCVKEALDQANKMLKDIDLISVTQGPGLVGSLLVGVSFAKALSVVTDIPVVGVNHMRGHIASCYISNPELKPPYIALVISGGHTYIMDVEDFNTMHKMGETRDDAAGESYDKVARVLGIGYPGGAELESLAENGTDKLSFPRIYLEKDSFDFSFSGLKTAVINYINTETMKGHVLNREDIANSFQSAVIDVIAEKVIRAAKLKARKQIAISGGVSNNKAIRNAIAESGKKFGIEIFYPEPKYTGDNAAMIGVEGFLAYGRTGESPINFVADPNMGL